MSTHKDLEALIHIGPNSTIFSQMRLLVLAAVGLALCSAFPEKLDALEDKLEDDEYEEEEKRPYSFSWAASRHYNGAPDREHQEQRGEDGITRGVYR